MLCVLIVLFLQLSEILALLLAVEVHLLALVAHVVPLHGHLDDLVAHLFKRALHVELVLHALVALLEGFHLRVVLRYHLLLVGFYLGVDILLCNVIYLFVNLSEVSVDLVPTHDLMLKRLLLGPVAKLLIVKHEFFGFCVVYNRCGR